MNDDYMFEDEVDEEAAAELERKRAEEKSQNFNNYNDYNSNNANNMGGAPEGYGPYKRRGTGKATASLVFGILSLVFFCSCINLVTAIIAIVLGASYLRNYDLREGKARAIAGIVTAALSIALFFGGYSFMTSNDKLLNLMDDDFIQFYYSNGSNMDEYEDLFEEYYLHQDKQDLNLDNTL